MIYTKKHRAIAENYLNNSCKGIIYDLLDEVGFTSEEIDFIKYRYIEFKPIDVLKDFLGFEKSKTYKIKERVLNKIYSHLVWKNNGNIDTLN